MKRWITLVIKNSDDKKKSSDKPVVNEATVAMGREKKVRSCNGLNLFIDYLPIKYWKGSLV